MTGKAKTYPWDKLAASPEFGELLAKKKRFVVRAVIFFAVYYFALPVLVGYFPECMSKKVFGPVNLAYLFALSQFVMAWGIAWLYVRKAAEFDKLAARIAAKGEK